jgi:crotonobetainyl-CoA:carnitine CoA-transferase CaiB-like acyl-CoA transferase
MDQVLEGIKVIDFSAYAAAPYCGRVLADMGANVIKVEPPNGDAQRTFGIFANTICQDDENPCFLAENSGKRGIVVNTKTEEGKQVLFDLLKDANVFFTNIRMPALEKMGLTYEDLKDKFPHLIYGHLSAYGLKGADSGLPGYDSTAFFGRVGAMVDGAYEGSGPLASIYGVGDNAVGMALAAGILGALNKQNRTGEGEYVLVSLYGASIGYHALTLASTQEGEGYNEKYPRDRMQPPTPLTNTYMTKDGAFMVSALKYEKVWPSFCKAIDREDLIDDVRYSTRDEAVKPENSRALVTMLIDIFKTNTSQYWADKLAAYDVPATICGHFRDVQHDEQAWVNGFLSEFTWPNGNKRMLANTPIQFKENVARPAKPAPGFGEHTDEVMHELGYSDEKIAQLKAIGAII